MIMADYDIVHQIIYAETKPDAIAKCRAINREYVKLARTMPIRLHYLVQTLCSYPKGSRGTYGVYVKILTQSNDIRRLRNYEYYIGHPYMYGV
jgi:hypothetical protein